MRASASALCGSLEVGDDLRVGHEPARAPLPDAPRPRRRQPHARRPRWSAAGSTRGRRSPRSAAGIGARYSSKRPGRSRSRPPGRTSGSPSAGTGRCRAAPGPGRARGGSRRRRARACCPRTRRRPPSASMPRCARRRSMSATRCQVVFSSSEAWGVLCPHPAGRRARCGRPPGRRSGGDRRSSRRRARRGGTRPACPRDSRTPRSAACGRGETASVPSSYGSIGG